MNNNQNGYNNSGNNRNGYGYNNPGNNQGGYGYGYNYNNTNYGTNQPQYGYGGGYRPSPGYVKVETPKMKRERAGIKTISIWSGIGVLLAFVVSFCLSFAAYIPGLKDAYNSSELFENGYGILTSLLFIGVPFLISYYALKRRTPFTLPYCRPHNKRSFALLIVIGVAGSFLANYVVAILASILSAGGLEMVSPEYTTPQTIAGRMLYVIYISVVPAITEEFAFRGVIMQPLRKYGDKFAIVMSALVFGLMHGNAVQAIFAFIVGLIIGYAVVVTGSMWTGIAIHFFNNFVSAAMDLLSDKIGTESYNLIYVLYSILLVIMGLISLIMYFRTKDRVRIPVAGTELSERKKCSAFICTPPLLVAMFLMVLSTLQSFKFNWG